MDSALNPDLVANLARLGLLEGLRAALEQRSIRVAYLKGAAFLDTLYPDLASRPMIDLDILVHLQDRPAVAQVLLERGLERVRVPFRPVTEQEHYEWLFAAQQPLRSIVEVHVGLCQPRLFSVDYDGLWERVVTYETPQRRVPALCPEDNLLHVALHAAIHSLEVDARYLEDIARILSVWSVDWQQVLQRAQSWGATAALFVCLAAAARRGARVPDGVLAALRPSLPRRALLESMARFPVARPGSIGRAPRLRQALLMPLIVDRWRALPGFVAEYAALRLRDAWRSRRREGCARPGRIRGSDKTSTH